MVHLMKLTSNNLSISLYYIVLVLAQMTESLLDRLGLWVQM
jgi:hypothetical protein